MKLSMQGLRGIVLVVCGLVCHIGIAIACTTTMSAADVVAFRNTSEAVLASLGRQRLPQLLIASVFPGGSINDWLTYQLCPYESQISSQAIGEIAQRADPNQWSAQANALFHVHLMTIAPNYFSSIKASLEKFEEDLPASLDNRSGSGKEVRAALDNLSLILANAKRNSAVAGTQVTSILFGTIDDERPKQKNSP